MPHGLRQSTDQVRRILPCHLLNCRFQGCGRTFSRNTFLLLLFRCYQEQLISQYHSRMAHTASNSNHSPVSCLNLQAPESFFFPLSFYFSPCPLSPLSPWANWASQNTKPTTLSSPLGFSGGKDFLVLLSCLHLLRTSTVILEDRHTCVCSCTQKQVFLFFFPQFVVSFSFLQKMQTKEKQGFQLKVHLFFNMKTLIELVGSPMQWSARSFGNWQNDIWRLRSWGLLEGTSLHESWAKGNGCGRRERARGEEYKRRKEKNVIGEEENGKLPVSSLYLLPFLPVDGWLQTPEGGASLLLVPLMHIVLSSLSLNVTFSCF